MIQIIIKSYDKTLIKAEVTVEEGKKLIEQLKEKEVEK